MTRIIRWVLTWTSGLLIFSFASVAWAQFADTFDEDFLSGFSEDGRIKLLLLKLAPSGLITESNSEEFVKAVQRNLTNTNHFTVVGPREIIEHLQDPILADCFDIACGLQMGNQFSADKIMVGQISREILLDDNSEEVPGFLLSIQVIDVFSKATDFSDEIQFTDDTMQDQLFELAQRISHNTLLRGRILSTGYENVVADLGRSHGLNIGDRFVIYTQASDLAGNPSGMGQENIAVAQINHLNDFSSEAIIIYGYEAPAPGDFIKTFVNRQKQIRLVANTRRELDTRKRLARPTRPLLQEPAVLAPPTDVAFQQDRLLWQQRLALAEISESRWMFISIGAGVGMVLLLTEQVDLGGSHEAVVLGGGIFTGYAAYQYFQRRGQVNALQAEGRVKKYISSWDYQLDIAPQGLNVSLNYKF